ncbi:MAG TPA: fumarylacetoacetate hydrolase family protein [Acidimicrobiia bacterium]|nr:fumarylacetoacetate hydrolase family protein [Acidimicrobiia bacterium]
MTFDDGLGPRVGVLRAGSVIDLSGSDASIPALMIDLIAAWPDLMDRVMAIRGPVLPLETVRLLAPIPRPRKNVFAVGRNYRDHAAEFSQSGFDASEKQMIPDHPVFFSKVATAIIGPGESIDTSNDPTGTTDYEGELAVVIGESGKRISVDRALEHVFGYTVINDLTARDLQKQHVQWLVGKSPDTFCPMGPSIATADEVDLSQAWLRTWVNQELRQESPVSALIFDVPTLVSSLSAVMTLEPGDIIATGTPLGVGIGFEPPRYLSPGDVVTIEVEGIGRLSNTVV